MAVKYTTVSKFWKFLGLSNNVLDFQAGVQPSRETIADATVASGDYYLDQPAANEDNLNLYPGSGTTALTLTTDYTFDSDLSKVTLTTAGAVTVSGENLTADYEYNSEGGSNGASVINYNESVRTLERAETDVDAALNTVFANQGATEPGYKVVLNETHPGEGTSNNLYNTNLYPIADISTTLSGDHVSGATSLEVTSASGFKSTGWLTISDTKVEFTARSGTTLTVPDTTPGLSGDSVVVGHVVEVNDAAVGTSPSWTTLVPNTDYTLDHNTGQVQLLSTPFTPTLSRTLYPQDGVNDRVRFTYNNAWHQLDQDATIPDEIENLVYMKASRMLLQRTIFKSQIGGNDNFDPQNIGFSEEDIERIQNKYRQTKISKV